MRRALCIIMLFAAVFSMLPVQQAGAGLDSIVSNIIRDVNQAVKAGDVTWRQLECSPQKLEKMKLKNQEKAAQLSLNFIRQNCEILDLSDLVPLFDKLRQAEADGATTLEKLGTSKEELKQWFIEKRDQLKRKYEEEKKRWQEQTPRDKHRPMPVIPGERNKRFELKDV